MHWQHQLRTDSSFREVKCKKIFISWRHVAHKGAKCVKRVSNEILLRHFCLVNGFNLSGMGSVASGSSLNWARRHAKPRCFVAIVSWRPNCLTKEAEIVPLDWGTPPTQHEGLICCLVRKGFFSKEPKPFLDDLSQGLQNDEFFCQTGSFGTTLRCSRPNNWNLRRGLRRLFAQTPQHPYYFETNNACGDRVEVCRRVPNPRSPVKQALEANVFCSVTGFSLCGVRGGAGHTFISWNKTQSSLTAGCAGWVVCAAGPSLLLQVSASALLGRFVNDVQHLARFRRAVTTPTRSRRRRRWSAGSDGSRHIRMRLDEIVLVERAYLSELQWKASFENDFSKITSILGGTSDEVSHLWLHDTEFRWYFRLVGSSKRNYCFFATSSWRFSGYVTPWLNVW